MTLASSNRGPRYDAGVVVVVAAAAAAAVVVKAFSLVLFLVGEDMAVHVYLLEEVEGVEEVTSQAKVNVGMLLLLVNRNRNSQEQQPVIFLVLTAKHPTTTTTTTTPGTKMRIFMVAKSKTYITLTSLSFKLFKFLTKGTPHR
jgi:hypothetical protein